MILLKVGSGKKMKKRYKSFDPSKFVIEHGALQVGTLGVVGITGKMAGSMPAGGAATASKITSSSSSLSLIPRIHAVGGVFSSLRGLEQQVHSKKKRY